ncbi:tRNA lysidine(34) synthetase TilS [Marinicella sp. S1101]|nr:tRNA lysidine(34) synthetase TilS [Marinicella marina]
MLSANNDSLLTDQHFPIAERYWVAFSGGVDSTALLYAVSQIPILKEKLTALHINHNIQDDAKAWTEHCQSFCHQLEINLVIESVYPDSPSEDSCRQARLATYNKHLNAGDCLLMAHHADDQIETILFRLFRGTGLHGLTGMAETQAMDHYMIHRPFLHLKKSTLIDYVQAHGLNHITDYSNNDDNYSRNHIRNCLIPAIIQYNKSATEKLIKTAENLSQSDDLLRSLLGKDNPLNITRINTPELLATALYHWIINIQHSPPSHNRLRQYAADCLYAAYDKNPLLDHKDIRLFRWQKQIFALNKLSLNTHSETMIALTNKASTPLKVGQLVFKSEKIKSLRVAVKYQQGSETIQTDIKRPHKTIKKLFQENQIPPWVRQCIPYIYIENKLVAVGSLFISHSFQQYLDENKAQIEWLSPNFLL